LAKVIGGGTFSPLYKGVKREQKGVPREHKGAGPESSGDAKIGSYESQLQS
jgi:hypothetical protein